MILTVDLFNPDLRDGSAVRTDEWISSGANKSTPHLDSPKNPHLGHDPLMLLEKLVVLEVSDIEFIALEPIQSPDHDGSEAHLQTTITSKVKPRDESESRADYSQSSATPASSS